MSQRKKFKEYFDHDLAVCLAEKIEEVYPEFKRHFFISAIHSNVEPLELKARVELFADYLQHSLPAHYPDALDFLLQILGPENQKETGMFDKWYWLMPVAFFVEKYGKDHQQESIAAIYEITKRFTGEYAIRPYIEKDPENVMMIMEKWSKDPNFHIRRLASEGCRPRLPWAKKLDLFVKDPTLALPILENLKEDQVLFVKRSVANHLNDILKDNYDIGMALIKDWSDTENIHTKWIIKHALRNQKKRGNQEAIDMINKM